MNGKKAKAIRRALREELKNSGEAWVAHPSFFVNMHGETMLKYTFQHGVAGGKKLAKYAKQIYKDTGMLPRNYDAKTDKQP